MIKTKVFNHLKNKGLIPQISIKTNGYKDAMKISIKTYGNIERVLKGDSLIHFRKLINSKIMPIYSHVRQANYKFVPINTYTIIIPNRNDRTKALACKYINLITFNNNGNNKLEISHTTKHKNICKDVIK